MKPPRTRQRRFAMPAMVVAVVLLFAGSLNVKGKDGMTVADPMGLTDRQTEFAAVEVYRAGTPKQHDLFGLTDSE